MRKFFWLAKLTLQSTTMYRTRILTLLLSRLTQMLTLYFVWARIASQTGGFQNLPAAQFVPYLLLSQGMGLMLHCSVDLKVSGRVRDGSVFMDLLKPVDYQLARLWEELGDAFVVLPFFVGTVATGLIQYHRNPSWLILPFLGSCILAYLLNFAYAFLVGIISFWTTSVWGLTMGRRVLAELLSGVLFPLALFPAWLANVMHYLPFRFMVDYPVSILLGRATGAEVWRGLMAQLFWVVALFLITRTLSRKAIRTLEVGGG
jgi:ABC-2 type transport system permease protein